MNKIFYRGQQVGGDNLVTKEFLSGESYLQSSALEPYVTQSYLSSQSYLQADKLTIEEWTFKLADNSYITKKIAVFD